MTVPERVKKRAEKFNMTVRDVAIKAGMGPSSIYKWKTQRPASNKLAAVANVLHTSTDYLLGNTDDPVPINSELKPDEQNLLLNLSPKE